MNLLVMELNAWCGVCMATTDQNVQVAYERPSAAVNIQILSITLHVTNLQVGLILHNNFWFNMI
jgi:hypothetical protein